MSLADKYIDKYISYVNHSVRTDPKKSWNKVMLGLQGHRLSKHLFPDQNITKGYQKLDVLIHDTVTRALAHPNRYVWGNIFSPCEIIHGFNLDLISVEALACYLGSGYNLEDFFIDSAQSIGIAPTLCSYHKAFVGAAISETVAPPRYMLTTSACCDGNLNTFSFMQKNFQIPFSFLDIPYQDDEDSIEYLADQLKEMVREMEEELGIPFDEQKLVQQLEIEKETRDLMLSLFEKMQTHYYPGNIIHQLWLGLGCHLLMGTPEFRDVIAFMNEEIETYPLFEGKTIFWIHLIPYYQQSLQSLFNSSEKYQILTPETIIDYYGEIDPQDPYRTLARKLIGSLFNGPYSRKIEGIKTLANELEPDAIIHFCHWGCKQASGGAVQLKEAMQEMSIPTLILDGDGIDSRNSHDGQIKTRLEAFLEMITGEHA